MKQFAAMVFTVLFLAANTTHAAGKFFSYGTGTNSWDTVSNFWGTVSGGPYSNKWVSNDDAVFEGTGGAVNLSSGQTADSVTFNTAGYILSNSTLTLAAPAAVTATVAGTISSPIAGTSGLNKSGADTLTLRGNNTYTGATTVNAGTLFLAGLNQAVKDVTLGAMTVNNSSSVIISNSVMAGALNLTAGTTVSAIGGPGLVGQYYTPAITLANYNTLSALLTSVAGYNPNLLYGSWTSTYLNNFDFGNTGAYFPPGYNSGNPTFGAIWSGSFNATTNGVYTFYTASDDGSMLWIDGTNVVFNNYAQAVTERSGTIALTNGLHDIMYGYYNSGGGYGFYSYFTAPGASKVAVPNSLLSSGPAIGSLSGVAGSTLSVTNGNLLISQTTAGTFSGVLTGSGGICKIGTSTLTLDGTSNDYAGSTTINAGALMINGNNTGTGAVIVNVGTLGGSGTLAGGVNVAPGAHIAPGAGIAMLTVGGLTLTSGSVIDAEFSLGGGQTNDQIAVTGSGSLTINGGSINLFNAGTNSAFSTPGTYNLISCNGGIGGSGLSALSVSNRVAGLLYTFATNNTGWITLTISSPVVWDGGGSDGNWQTANNWSNDTVPVPPDALAFAGTVRTSNNNDFTGATFGGVVFNSNAGSFVLSGNALTLSGGVYNDCTNAQTMTMPLTLASGGGLFSAGSGGLTVNGAVDGSQALIKDGNSSLILSGSNTYSGGTTIRAGSVQVGVGGTSGTFGPGPVAMSSGTQLTLNRSDSVTFSNVLSGAGTIYKMTGNTATFSGNSTFSGTVQLASGGFAVNGTMTGVGTGQQDGSSTVNWTANGALSANNLNLGVSGNAYGTLAVNVGGTATVGTMQIAGGSGNWGGSAGTVNINAGGTATVGTMQLAHVGWSQASTSTATINVNSNGILNATNIYGVATDWGCISPAIYRYINVNANGRLNAASINLSQSGANAQVITLSGGTLANIPGGNLTVDSTTAVTLTGSGVVEASTSNSVTINGIVQSTGSLVKTGAGTITLTGVNTFSGGLMVSNGVAALSGGAAIADTCPVILATNVGATLQLNASETIGSLIGGGATGGVVSNQSYTLTVAGTNSATFDGVIAGTGVLARQGTGTQTLTGSNTYTGVTTVNGGTLVLNGTNGSATASSGITLNGGTLLLNNTADANNGDRLGNVMVTANGGTLSFVNDAGVADFTETLGVLKVNQNSSSINASQAAPGQISVLTFSSLSNSAAGTVNFTGVGLGEDTRNQILFSNSPALVGGVIGTWATVNGELATYGAYGVVAFAGYNDVTRLSSGLKVIPDDATNSVRIVEGSGAPGAITLGAAVTTLNALDQSAVGGGSLATIDLAGQTLVLNNILVATGSGGLTIGTLVNNGTLKSAGTGLAINNSSTNNAIVNSVIVDGTGSSYLSKSGAGPLILNGTNTYTGGTILGQGTLVLGCPTALGAGTLTINAGVLDSSVASLVNLNNNAQVWNGDFTYAGSQSLDVGTGAVSLGTAAGVSRSLNVTNSLTVGGSITNGMTATSLVKTGAGTLTLSGVSLYTGSTTVNAGKLEVGGAGRLGGGSYAGAISNNAALAYSSSAAQTFSGVVVGNGSLTIAGAGVLTLSGANITYTGTTIVSNGVLQLLNASGFASATTVTNGATVLLSNTANLAVGGGATFALRDGTTLTHNGSVNGGAFITMAGAVNVSGAAVINQNSVTNTTGANKNLFLDGGLTGAGTLTINAANPGNAVIFRNSNHTFNGAMIVNGVASTTVNAGSGIGVGGATTTFGNIDVTLNGTMELLTQGIGWAATANGAFTMGALSGTGVMVGNYTGGGGCTVTLGNNGHSGSFSGVIANGTGNTVNLVKVGAGTQTLSGANSYTGNTTINAGTFVIGGGGQLANGAYAGAIAIASNATLMVNSTAAQTFSGVISGVGALTKTNSGTVTLSGANAYTGTVTVAQGTLRLVSSNALTQTSAVVLAGGTLDAGSNTMVAGTLTVASDSTILLGTGSLQFTNSSAKTWSGYLSLSGALTPQALRFGTNSVGLTKSQQQQMNSQGRRVRLDDAGFVVLASGTLIMLE